METSLDGQQKGFFGRLFDLSFRTFVTPSIIKVVYVLVIALCLLGYLIEVAAGFRTSAAFGVALVILLPIVYLLTIIWARMILEVVMAIFRIASNTEIVAFGGPSGGRVPVPPAPSAPLPHLVPPASFVPEPHPVPAAPPSPPAAPAAQVTTPPPPQPQSVRCAACGSTVEAGDVFCSTCGSPRQP